mmetsp:Transcript_11861/g.17632  ORF Transcript_11861/g.17632 Transcript_11861/m.17632 type:complete len:470 (-) Transcript_11861:156-1565(-)
MKDEEPFDFFSQFQSVNAGPLYRNQNQNNNNNNRTMGINTNDELHMSWGMNEIIQDPTLKEQYTNYNENNTMGGGEFSFENEFQTEQDMYPYLYTMEENKVPQHYTTEHQNNNIHNNNDMMNMMNINQNNNNNMNNNNLNQMFTTNEQPIKSFVDSFNDTDFDINLFQMNDDEEEEEEQTSRYQQQQQPIFQQQQQQQQYSQPLQPLQPLQQQQQTIMPFIPTQQQQQPEYKISTVRISPSTRNRRQNNNLYAKQSNFVPVIKKDKNIKIMILFQTLLFDKNEHADAINLERLEQIPTNLNPNNVYLRYANMSYRSERARDMDWVTVDPTTWKVVQIDAPSLNITNQNGYPQHYMEFELNFPNSQRDMKIKTNKNLIRFQFQVMWLDQTKNNQLVISDIYFIFHIDSNGRRTDQDGKVTTSELSSVYDSIIGEFKYLNVVDGQIGQTPFSIRHHTSFSPCRTLSDPIFS